MIEQQPGLSKSLVLLMAFACGAAVANIYYNQPILTDIAASFGVQEEQAGRISMLSQIGYGIGLFFLTPLGDKVNRKKLILILLFFLSLVLGWLSLTSNFTAVLWCSLLVGILSVSVQVIIPLAASLDNKTRGKTLGTLFSGLLVGIFIARVISGAVAEWLNWRYVYGFSAVLMLVLIILLQLFLPSVKQDFKGHYISLLNSTLLQLKRFVILRQAALIGALIFGAFCSFWTTFTFHLGGKPFGFSTATIGLFGFVAIAGALAAPVFGKLSDKGNPKNAMLFTLTLLIASILLLMFFPYNVVMLVIAVLLLDIGVQATHITNIARVYALDPAANSRLNTVYMTSYFTGGAIGTFAGLLCWKAGGWHLVTIQMLVWSAAAFMLCLAGKKGTVIQDKA
jgi:predicted MFS family arabinose efflux permease